MPSVSDRLRRPLDEAMLLRLVMAIGLVKADELTKFYAGGGGRQGGQNIQEYLAARGVDVTRLDAIKRAYAETPDFGTLLLRFMRSRAADDAKLRAVNRALNACETAQLMAIKKGKRAKPIGEMMVELGHITVGDLELLVAKQGLAEKVTRYAEEARVKSTLAGRLGLDRPGRRDLLVKAGVIALGIGLVVVIALNLWLGRGESDKSVDELVFGGSFDPANTNQHLHMIGGHYENMLTELRLRNVRNAQEYRGRLDKYFKALEVSKVMLEDSNIQHIRKTYGRLDFSKLDAISAQELPKLSLPQLEARLSP